MFQEVTTGGFINLRLVTALWITLNPAQKIAEAGLPPWIVVADTLGGQKMLGRFDSEEAAQNYLRALTSKMNEQHGDF